jgi:hypothetical protein
VRAENPDKTIAVAFAVYRKDQRDFVRKISGEPVSFVQIDVTKAELVSRNMPRVEDFAKAAGKTSKEVWELWECEKKHGPYVEGCWDKLFLDNDYTVGFQNVTEAEPDTFRLDSGIKSVGTIPGLEKVLGLKHIEDPDIKAVCAINNERAGENIKQKELVYTNWKDKIEKKLTAGCYIGGEAPNDEDKHAYWLLTTKFDSEGFAKFAAITEEEGHPLMLKWMKAMAGDGDGPTWKMNPTMNSEEFKSTVREIFEFTDANHD